MSNFQLKVINKEIHFEDVVILDLQNLSSKEIKFIPGQYFNLFYRGLGRPYTILSKNKDQIKIAVRRKGEFSSLLFNLSVGEILEADQPDGFFYPENISSQTKIIYLSGGIGIVPFYAWIQNPNLQSQKFEVLFSNSTLERAPFLAELKKQNNITLKLFITRQTNISSEMINRRINEKDIKNAIPNNDNYLIAICGSVAFVREIWGITKKLAVPEEKILTESLF